MKKLTAAFAGCEEVCGPVVCELLCAHLLSPSPRAASPVGLPGTQSRGTIMSRGAFRKDKRSPNGHGNLQLALLQ